MKKDNKNPQPGKLRIAMMGTRGVPAAYGGFETCIEEVGSRLAARGHDVIVYCRGVEPEEQLDEYLGMRLIHKPAVRKRSLETLSHTGFSVVDVLGRGIDAALVFNAANAPWLPLLRAARIPVATHMDGLEWQRGKWGPTGQRYYKAAERMAVSWSNELIADAAGIGDYYLNTHHRETVRIAYGAPKQLGSRQDKLPELGLHAGQYHLLVARFEPENHVGMIVEGYARSNAKMPLIVVGSAPYSAAYVQKVHAAADSRVIFLGGVWDQELLNQLYANAFVYWHGHSVGGTNPSLLRAIGAGTATNAFNVSFNEEVLRTSGRYFSDSVDVRHLVELAEDAPEEVVDRGRLAYKESLRYDWDEVAHAYERLCFNLAGRRPAAEPVPTDGRLRL